MRAEDGHRQRHDLESRHVGKKADTAGKNAHATKAERPWRVTNLPLKASDWSLKRQKLAETCLQLELGL
jgi:hypothetical protein